MNVPGASATESVIVTDDELAHERSARAGSLDELRRVEGASTGVNGSTTTYSRPLSATRLELLLPRRQQQRRRRRVHDLERMRTKVTSRLGRRARFGAGDDAREEIAMAEVHAVERADGDDGAA